MRTVYIFFITSFLFTPILSQENATTTTNTTTSTDNSTATATVSDTSSDTTTGLVTTQATTFPTVPPKEVTSLFLILIIDSCKH